MTNKQLYNLVFENFVQAKRELLREGYHKKHLEEVDFKSIFEQSKQKMLQEKVKSLQRENQMLKEKLSQRRGLEEAGTMTAAGMGKQGGGAGSEEVGTGMDRIGAFFKDKGSIAALAAKELDKAKDADGLSFFDRMTDRYPNTTKKGLIDAFRYKMTTNLENRMSKDEAKISAMKEMDRTLSESRRRRRY